MKIDFSKFLKNDKIRAIDIELTENLCAKGFGLSLKRLRKLKGLTLDELSEKIEITNPTLNRYESGYNLPSIFMALKIAYFFDVNIEVMLIAGLLELQDIENGVYQEESKYIEHFVGFSDKLNTLFEKKPKITFNDHKKKKR